MLAFLLFCQWVRQVPVPGLLFFASHPLWNIVCSYPYESWTIKKAEAQKIDAFRIVLLEKTLESPLSNQSILKEVNPELEGLRLKLKLQSFDHLMQRADSLEKTLMLGKIECRRKGDNRGWDGWMASLTQWTQVWANCGRQWRTGKPGVLQSLGSQRVRHNWVTEQQQITEEHRSKNPQQNTSKFNPTIH